MLDGFSVLPIRKARELWWEGERTSLYVTAQTTYNARNHLYLCQERRKIPSEWIFDGIALRSEKNLHSIVWFSQILFLLPWCVPPFSWPPFLWYTEYSNSCYCSSMSTSTFFYITFLFIFSVYRSAKATIVPKRALQLPLALPLPLNAGPQKNKLIYLYLSIAIALYEYLRRTSSLRQCRHQLAGKRRWERRIRVSKRQQCEWRCGISRNQ